MTIPTGSLFNVHADRIEEIINKNIGAFLPGLDPVYMDTIASAQGVGPADDLGRDWKLLKVFHTGLTGVIDGGGPQGDFPIYGDTDFNDNRLGKKLWMQQLEHTWPDPLKGPNPAPFRLGVPMRSILTNLLMTMGEMSADVQKAFIGNYIMPKLTGFARNVGQKLCNYTYLSQNDFYALASIVSGEFEYLHSHDDPSSSEPGDILRIDITASTHAVHRFFVGQRLNLFTSNGATKRASSTTNEDEFIVTAVDPLTGFVDLMLADGSEIEGEVTIADGDIIVFANTKGNSNTPFASGQFFTGIAGLNSWMKTGDTSGFASTNVNTLLGAERDSSNSINVNVHPEFKSMFLSLGGNPLTEHMLRKILRRWHAQEQMWGNSVDTLIWSDGVAMAYEATKIGREFIDRTGRLSSMRNEGSQEGFQFSMDGRTYTAHTSHWIEDGTVYGIRKGGGNWKRYVPPDFSGLQQDDKAAPFHPFRFVGSAMTGTNSRQIPIFKTQTGSAGANTLLTEGVALPGWVRMQLVPDQPAGIKLTNVGSERIYADS
jgi:hypothetical protein